MLQAELKINYIPPIPDKLSGIKKALALAKRQGGLYIVSNTPLNLENIKLVCLDLDATIIKAESINLLAKTIGKEEIISAITSATMDGEINFIESFTKRVKLLKGIHTKTIKDLATTLPLADGIIDLISALKLRGIKSAIISGNFNIIVQIVQERCGIDYQFSSTPSIRNESLTGNIEGQIIDCKKKGEILLELCKRERISPKNVIAIGDGANDIDMLYNAEFPIAYNATGNYNYSIDFSL